MKTLTLDEIKVLNLLEESSAYTTEEISQKLSIDSNKIQDIILNLKKEGVILKYKAIINWEKIDSRSVTALIQVSVAPQEGAGYDKVANQISKLHEVKTCFLVSGSFDLLVEIEGASLQNIASFIADKLSIIEGVTHTRTNFLLKKYKQSGDLLMSNKTHRLPLSV